MRSIAVYVKEELLFARDLSLEISADSHLSFWPVLVRSVSYFFFFYQSPSLSLCKVFHAISSDIGEVLLIDQSTSVFVFDNFNLHHLKTG